MQPNSYSPQYQYSTAAPTPMPAPAATPPQPHHHSKLLPLTILLALISLGLIAYILIDKFVFTGDDHNTSDETITAQIFDSLSSLNIANDDNYNANMAQALAGRLFTVNASSDQTLKFTSSEDYIYSYYRNPTADYRKIVSSTNHGKFTVDGEYIRLESGDEFRIVGDYLVKSKDQLSSNQYYVYFDNYQLYNLANGLNNSLNDYFARMKKSNSYLPTTEKSHIDIDSAICKADRTNTNITNADAYICGTYYTQYFNESSTTQLYQSYKYTDFLNYCWHEPNIQTYATGGSCSSNSSLQNYANIIIRLTDHANYRVSGIYREDNSKMEISTGVDPNAS